MKSMDVCTYQRAYHPRINFQPQSNLQAASKPLRIRDLTYAIFADGSRSLHACLPNDGTRREAGRRVLPVVEACTPTKGHVYGRARARRPGRACCSSRKSAVHARRRARVRRGHTQMPARSTSGISGTNPISATLKRHSRERPTGWCTFPRTGSLFLANARVQRRRALVRPWEALFAPWSESRRPPVHAEPFSLLRVGFLRCSPLSVCYAFSVCLPPSLLTP